MTEKSKTATKEIIYDSDNVAIGYRFKFENGEIVEALLADHPDHIQNLFAIHGMGQKYGDSYAARVSKGWSIADCISNLKDLIATCVSGDWSAGRTSTGGKLLLAFVRAMEKHGSTYEEVRDLFDAMSKEEKDDLRKHPEVKAALATIEAEAAAKAAEAAEEADSPSLDSLFKS